MKVTSLPNKTQEEDNPYVVSLDPEEFNELLEEYSAYLQWSEKTLLEESPEKLELAQRVLQKLLDADNTHICVDEIEEAERESEVPDPIEDEYSEEADELDQLAQLPQALRKYRAQAKQENLVLKFHIFCDRTDDFTTDFADAMALYWQHRYKGQPNVRLYLELQEPEDDEMRIEDSLLSYGDFPD